MQATGAINWRRADVRYKKNEAFVDVIENVNLNMSAKGNFNPSLQESNDFYNWRQGTSFELMWMAIYKWGRTCPEHLSASSGSTTSSSLTKTTKEWATPLN